MNKVLLTGATGFLGSHLLEALLRQGDRVTILKRSTSDTWRIKHLLNNVETFDVDVQPLEDAFKAHKFDAVIHTACTYGRSGEPPHKVVETNLLFGVRLLDAAILFNSETFLNTDTFFNTDTLSYKYLNDYSLSKKQFAEWLKQRREKIQVINMKLQHVYGPKDDQNKFIPWLISKLYQNVSRIPLTEGAQQRDFIYVGDVVAAYLLTIKKKKLIPRFREFNVGTGIQMPVRSFVEKLVDLFGEEICISNSTLGFGDKSLHQGELTSVSIDNTALLEIGWSSKYSIEQGIRMTIKG